MWGVTPGAHLVAVLENYCEQVFSTEDWFALVRDDCEEVLGRVTWKVLRKGRNNQIIDENSG